MPNPQGAGRAVYISEARLANRTGRSVPNHLTRA
jgi:hypothetical protein